MERQHLIKVDPAERKEAVAGKLLLRKREKIRIGLLIMAVHGASGADKGKALLRFHGVANAADEHGNVGPGIEAAGPKNNERIG